MLTANELASGGATERQTGSWLYTVPACTAALRFNVVALSVFRFFFFLLLLQIINTAFLCVWINFAAALCLISSAVCCFIWYNFLLLFFRLALPASSAALTNTTLAFFFIQAQTNFIHWENRNSDAQTDRQLTHAKYTARRKRGRRRGEALGVRRNLGTCTLELAGKLPLWERTKNDRQAQRD